MTDIVERGPTGPNANCPSKVTVTLTGSASGWADSLKATSPDITHYSDGYKITVVAGTLNAAPTNGQYVGGCLRHATNASVCFVAPAVANG